MVLGRLPRRVSGHERTAPMHSRLAAYLTVLALLTVSWEACAQLPPPGSPEAFTQTGADGSIQIEPLPIDAIPGGGLILALYIYFMIAFSLFMIASLWILFTKADQPGWTCLIPIYNTIVLLQIAGKPWWWLILYVIPVVGFVISIIHMIALAEAFGKGVGYGIGLVFLGFIFLPLLAFGDAEYSGGGWKGA